MCTVYRKTLSFLRFKFFWTQFHPHLIIYKKKIIKRNSKYKKSKFINSIPGFTESKDSDFSNSLSIAILRPNSMFAKICFSWKKRRKKKWVKYVVFICRKVTQIKSSKYFKLKESLYIGGLIVWIDILLYVRNKYLLHCCECFEIFIKYSYFLSR
jgi:hypothetical protein